MGTMHELKEWARKQTTEVLKSQFEKGVERLRERLLRMAAIAGELRNRHHDIDGDKHLIRLLLKIFDGELLVDVVVRFTGRPYTLASVARCPVSDQEEFMRQTDQEVEVGIRTRQNVIQRERKIDKEKMLITSTIRAVAKTDDPIHAANCLIDALSKFVNEKVAV